MSSRITITPNASISLGQRRGIVMGGVRDSTPAGPNDVWMWEDGIGLQWETGIFMRIE